MDFSGRFREWSLKTEFVSSDEKRHLHPDAEPDVWQRGARLGGGGFGDVFKEICVDGPRKHQTRAVKQIRKSPDNMRLVQRELGVLVDFSTDNNKHDSRDNFVRFLGWFSDNVHLYIAMELVPFGDLQSHISTHPSSERDTAVIIGQVGRALQYMHERNYVHRDLKPANILVARPGPDWHVKLTDFGISKNIDNTKLQTQVGTEAYMAPELFDRNDGKINITSAVDVWSLGAVAFCIRTGKAPFANTYELCRFSSGTTRFPTQPLMRSSTEFFDFILGLMEKSPAGRLTISEALDHDWVSGVFGSSTRSKTVLPARNEDEWEAPASAMWNTGVPPASQPSLRLSQRTSEDTIRPVSTSSRSLPVVNGNSHYRYENAVPQKLETPATATRLPSPRREHQKSEGLNAGTAFRHPIPSSPAKPTATSTRPLSPISETLRREARNKLETRPSWTSYLDGLYDARLKFKPRWDSPGWLSGGHEVMVKVPYFDGNIRGLNSVMALVGLRANITTIPLQLRQTLVSSGWDAAADTGFARLDPSATNYIFDTDGREYQKIADDLERLALARAFSLEFNAFADPAPIIEFPIVPFVTMPFITGNNRDWFFLEDHNYSMSAKDLSVRPYPLLSASV